MKIDFAMLEKLETAGATAKVIIEYLRPMYEADEARKVKKRPGDAKRIRERRAAKKSDTSATAERQAATLDDSHRARLFREGAPALITLGISESRARSLIASWLKLTHDDEQLVLASILKAQGLAVVDAPGWILTTLKGKTNGNGTRKSLAATADDLIARSESRDREDSLGDLDDGDRRV